MKTEFIDSFDMTKPFPRIPELHWVIYKNFCELTEQEHIDYKRKYKRYCSRKQAVRPERKAYAKEYHIRYYEENRERLLQHMKDTYVYEKKVKGGSATSKD